MFPLLAWRRYWTHSRVSSALCYISLPSKTKDMSNFDYQWKSSLEWSFKGKGISIECWSRTPCQKIKPPWASCQIGKIVGCACAGNAGNVFPATDFKRKTLVSDPNIHHGTCVTHVPWCMSGSLTTVAGKTFPAFPGHAQPAILRIWQDAHWMRIHRGQNFNRQ